MFERLNEMMARMVEWKREIIEVTDFIKEVTESNKQELNKDVLGLRVDLEKNLNDVFKCCSMQEIFSASLESKVDIKEVQNALNDYQQEITNQLTSHQTNNSESLQKLEMSMSKLIEKKIDPKDLQLLIQTKVDKSELFE